MDALSLCVRSTSLGDVFTGVLHPATASHREVAPKRRRELGISEGRADLRRDRTYRILIADIEEALAARARKKRYLDTIDLKSCGVFSCT